MGASLSVVVPRLYEMLAGRNPFAGDPASRDKVAAGGGAGQEELRGVLSKVGSQLPASAREPLERVSAAIV